MFVNNTGGEVCTAILICATDVLCRKCVLSTGQAEWGRR